MKGSNIKNMDRRESMKLLVCSAPALLCGKALLAKKHHSSNIEEYLYASVVDKISLSVPKDKRVPFSWKAFGLEPAVPYKFEFKYGAVHEKQNAWLRISVALDVREEKKVEARIAEINTLIGIFDIRFSPVLHTYQIPVESKHVDDILKYGVKLELKESTKPLWIFEETPGFTSSQNIFKPHLMIEPNQPVDKIDNFVQKLISLNALQPFGWMEGCVLDGLYQIYRQKDNKEALSALQNHIDMFFVNDRLIYESSRSEPMDDDFEDIEATLPIAIMAQVIDENHPIFDFPINFWMKRLKMHGEALTNRPAAEENYTIAYPMAVLGVKRNNFELIELAIKQLIKRKDTLVYNGNNYLRCNINTGERTFRNWARGIVWYALGMVRTIEVVEPYVDISILKTEFKRTVDFILKYQNEDGLWSCFIDRPEVAIDTSGSSGLAAAIASGVKLGYIDNSYAEYSEKAWTGLQHYLTTDGLLTGVAQSNRNGEEFQASDYRVISQMGMGLMGQLYAQF